MATFALSAAAASVHHPAALRNRGPICEALREFGLGREAGLALEIGSGTGAHLEALAAAFPAITWQPSEFIPPPGASEECPAGTAVFDESIRTLSAIDTFGFLQFANVLRAVALDAGSPFERWPPRVGAARGQHRLIYCANVCHISPWEVTCGIISGASRALAPGGSLVLYGPFFDPQRPAVESNAAFDRSLRERNSEWGVRDIQALVDHACGEGMKLLACKDMPANNYVLRFVRLPA
ncbi:hypothetical protein T492DRAFT_634095 [Pavlovales sp. CCMP2436]|nr:hypothetical protein T492DRAFT_634095 [Pavlovales sp. CCMP2436]